MKTHPLDDLGHAPLDDRWIDQLVDGELTQEDRTRVLQALANRPEGWRRCALAFLEAQTWNSCFRELTEHSITPTKPDPQTLARADLGRPWVRWVLAAGLLLTTFAAGFGTGRSLPLGGASTAPSASGGLASVAGQAVEDGSPPGLSSSIAWVSDDGTAIPADETASSLLLEEVPSYLITLWQRQGFDVEQIQRTRPVILTNGGQIDLPIRDVRLRYVGNDPL